MRPHLLFLLVSLGCLNLMVVAYVRQLVAERNLRRYGSQGYTKHFNAEHRWSYIAFLCGLCALLSAIVMLGTFEDTSLMQGLLFASAIVADTVISIVLMAVLAAWFRSKT